MVGKKILLTNQCWNFFHMIKTMFSRIPADKKNMASENVANNTENLIFNKLNTLAIYHAVRTAQG